METKPFTAHGFVMDKPDSLPEVYADGIGASLLSIPMSKISFYSVSHITDDGLENRVPQVRIVMPTGALIEFCRNILATASQSGPGLQEGYEIQKKFVARVVDGLSITPTPPDIGDKG